jgi:hypothetical protein
LLQLHGCCQNIEATLVLTRFRIRIEKFNSRQTNKITSVTFPFAYFHHGPKRPYQFTEETGSPHEYTSAALVSASGALVYDTSSYTVMVLWNELGLQHRKMGCHTIMLCISIYHGSYYK